MGSAAERWCQLGHHYGQLTMKRLLVVLALLASISPLHAQVRQSGNVTPRHAACWTSTGVIQDCGSASIPFLSSIGTVGSGPTICASSGPSSAAYNRVCLSATATGGGVTMDNIGGATGGFTFTLNGSEQGIVTITVPTVPGGQACFSDTDGTLADCPITVTNGLLQFSTRAAAIAANLSSFSVGQLIMTANYATNGDLGGAFY